MWYPGTPRVAASIAAEARTANWSALEHVRIALDPETPKYGIKPHSNDKVAGFESLQLRNPVWIEIRSFESAKDKEGRAITNPETCARQRVAFRSAGSPGAVMPDTARGEIMEEIREEIIEGTRKKIISSVCIARMNWQMGDGPGARFADAKVIPFGGEKHGADVRLQTRARRLPRIVGGIALSRHNETFVVRQPVNGVVNGGPIDTVKARFLPTGIVGITGTFIPSSFLVPPVMIATRVTSPGKDLFLGFSPIRWAFARYWGEFEGFPMDLNIVGHWGEQTELSNRALCESGGACETRGRWVFHGIGGVFSVDAAGLFSDLIKAIGK
jgi:hypothetical protein